MHCTEPTLSDYVNPRLAEALLSRRDQFVVHWMSGLESLQARRTSGARCLEEERKGGKDLFSVVLKLLQGDRPGFVEGVYYWVDKVWRPDYSISDFYRELNVLEDTLEAMMPLPQFTPEENDAHRGLIHRLARPILEEVMNRTSDIYEHVAHQGPDAFCLLDPHGRIVRATPQAWQLLGSKEVEGTLLADYFPENEQESIHSAIERGEMLTRELRVVQPDDRERHCWASIQPLMMTGKQKGAYAVLTDVTGIKKTERLVFDNLPLAVVEIDRNHHFTDANPCAREWLGKDILEKSLPDIVPPDIWPEMKKQLAKRRSGEGGFYDAELIQADGQSVPVKIAGIPRMSGRGEHMGSTGLIRNLQFETVAEAIHNVIGKPRDDAGLLDEVAREVRKLVPFDYFGVSRYSSDLNHTMSFYRSEVEGPSFQSVVRWWKIPDFLRPTLSEPRMVGDFVAMMRRPELAEYLNHPTLREFVAAGYQSYLRIPVLEGGKPVACATFFSRGPDRYSQQHVDLLCRLPIKHAMQMALHYCQVEERAFRHQLLQGLLACDDPAEVAKQLVSKLSKHYGWEHAAIFRVDDVEQTFRLVAQHSVSDVRLDEAFRQPIGEGVLGQVLKTGRSLNLADTRRAEEWHVRYKPLHEDIRSELCVPITASPDYPVQMLLNVEDNAESAFSCDEVAVLEDIVEEIRPVVARLYRQFVLRSAFRTSSDAFMVTDALGNIRKANRAALALLDYSSETELQKPLKSLFAEEQDAHRLLSPDEIDDRSTRLVRQDGKLVEAMVEFSDLPEDAGGGKFVNITDLAPIRRLQKLEAIGEFYYELATQTMTPLSLVKSWLARLVSSLKDDTSRDLADKALLQLNRAEITYQRMALYDEEQRRRIPTKRVPLDLAVELRLLRQELPRSEAKQIELREPSTPAVVRGDRVQVAFIFKTILGYLLRHLPPDGGIRVNIRKVDGSVQVKILGHVAPKADEPDKTDFVEQAKFQLALGEPVIRTFAANNRATYHKPRRRGSRMTFQIDFRRDDAAQEGKR